LDQLVNTFGPFLCRTSGNPALKQCSQRPGRMDMPGMTLPRQLKRLICTINLRRVFGGRLELVGPLIV